MPPAFFFFASAIRAPSQPLDSPCLIPPFPFFLRAPWHAAICACFPLRAVSPPETEVSPPFLAFKKNGSPQTHPLLRRDPGLGRFSQKLFSPVVPALKRFSESHRGAFAVPNFFLVPRPFSPAFYRCCGGNHPQPDGTSGIFPTSPFPSPLSPFCGCNRCQFRVVRSSLFCRPLWPLPPKQAVLFPGQSLGRRVWRVALTLVDFRVFAPFRSMLAVFFFRRHSGNPGPLSFCVVLSSSNLPLFGVLALIAAHRVFFFFISQLFAFSQQ